MLKAVLVAAGVVAGAAAAVPQLLDRLAPPAPERAKPAALAPSSSREVVLRADRDGHFRTDAMISGRRVPMLVDTGATVVALSYEQGRTLGLVSGGDRFDLMVSTANGQVGAKRVVLSDVRVGSVSVPNVTAVVLSPGAMDGNLLGMSFLGRLRRMEAARDRLTLER
ncbi:TIGR02281 family clan AA aspartic protease [Methylopila henanensis]|uniref:TIGR02281 family clan AA aspartic protease n=1 Tax=Methylopila henanensis TaxID=873516 RepID=A0ABW4K8J9_9HYPH